MSATTDTQYAIYIFPEPVMIFKPDVGQCHILGPGTHDECIAAGEAWTADPLHPHSAYLLFALEGFPVKPTDATMQEVQNAGQNQQGPSFASLPIDLGKVAA